MIFPDPKMDRPYQIHWINDDPKSFPIGGIDFLNLTRVGPRLELAGSPSRVVGSGMSIVIIPATKDFDAWRMFHARIELQKMSRKWVPASSPSWKAVNEKRDTVILRVDEKTKMPRVSSYSDIRPEMLPSSVEDTRANQNQVPRNPPPLEHSPQQAGMRRSRLGL